MSEAKSPAELRECAARERNATTALELRVKALEIEVAALKSAKKKAATSKAVSSEHA